jgi:hypothetical protein
MARVHQAVTRQVLRQTVGHRFLQEFPGPYLTSLSTGDALVLPDSKSATYEPVVSTGTTAHAPLGASSACTPQHSPAHGILFCAYVPLATCRCGQNSLMNVHAGVPLGVMRCLCLTYRFRFHGSLPASICTASPATTSILNSSQPPLHPDLIRGCLNSYCMAPVHAFVRAVEL